MLPLRISMCSHLKGNASVFLFLLDKAYIKVKNKVLSRVAFGLKEKKTYSHKVNSTTRLNTLFTDNCFAGCDFPDFTSICNDVFNNTFDLLGSGTVRVVNEALLHDPDVWFVQNINPANVAYAQSVYQKIKGQYTPVDWQSDFKSGYRWLSCEPAYVQRFAHLPGVDIKVPWELARMHHLVPIAMHYVNVKDERCVSFFQNHLLDFIATNPPKFGVNWVCAMDVAIRAANCVLAYDILASQDAQFDAEFDRIFINTLYDHVHFIMNHLERHPISKANSNHYLANIVGLLFLAAYLPETECARKDWLFASKEFINEVANQFNEEGTHREGSTAYHCLCAQMVIFAFGLIETTNKRNVLPTVIFPEWLPERISKMLKFIRDMTKPNDELVQIGDNDSGRLLKCHPNNYASDKLLDYTDIIASGGCISKNDSVSLEKIILDTYSTPDMALSHPNTNALQSRYIDNVHKAGILLAKNSISLSDSFDDSVHVFAYPQFGIVGLRNESSYISLRLPALKQYPVSGHYHNDIFALELFIDGKALTRDPGSYCYTSFPKLRNHYRSAAAHYSSLLFQAYDPKNKKYLFHNPLPYKLLSFSISKHEITAEVSVNDKIFKRTLYFNDKALHIFDYSNQVGDTTYDKNYLDFRAYQEKIIFSRGYGVLGSDPNVG